MSTNCGEVRASKERGSGHYSSGSNRSASFMQINDYRRAKEDAESCISLKPTWPKGYSRLGNSLLKLRKIQEAEHAFERCVALDPANREAAAALHHTRALLGHSSSSSGSDSDAAGGPFGSTSFQFPPGVNMFLDRARRLCAQGLSQSLLAWSRLSDSHKQMAIGVVVALLGYWLFFSGRSGGYGYGYDGGYDSGYDGGYGGGWMGRGGGMSWTLWGALMAAGYYLPPMFPDVLGPERARPFFGMSWTTFMWLLSMLGNRMGGRRRRGFGY